MKYTVLTTQLKLHGNIHLYLGEHGSGKTYDMKGLVKDIGDRSDDMVFVIDTKDEYTIKSRFLSEQYSKSIKIHTPTVREDELQEHIMLEIKHLLMRTTGYRVLHVVIDNFDEIIALGDGSFEKCILYLARQYQYSLQLHIVSKKESLSEVFPMESIEKAYQTFCKDMNFYKKSL